MIRAMLTFVVVVCTTPSVTAGLIDSEDAGFGADNDVISSNYFASHGVAFSAIAGRNINQTSAADLIFEAAGEDIGHAFSGDFGFDIDRREQFQLTAFESGGTAVASLLSPDGRNDNHDALPWSWSFSGNDISRVEIEYVGNGSIGGFAFDNLQFTPTGQTHSAPLPVALPLGLVGLLGVALTRRRQSA